MMKIYLKITIYAFFLMLLLPVKADKLILSNDGKTGYTILISQQPLSTEVKAAKELRHYLKKITGVEFPVINEIGNGRRSKGKVISIGKTIWALQTMPKELNVNLGDAGYCIATKNGDLFLFGNKRRGTLNAVYAFLEDDLGCRWYNYRVERIPHNPELAIEVKNRSSVPAFPSIRDPLNDSSNHVRWALRNRTEPLYLKIPAELGGRKVVYTTPWYAHTYNKIAPKKLFATHPEYFAMKANGKRNPEQRCPSNPGFQQLAVKFALDELRKKPDCNYVMIGSCDNYNFCHCPKCITTEKRGGARSTAHMELVNKVAAAVAKKFPKARVATLAYHATGMSPKNIKFHPNVVIWLCTDSLASEIRQKPIYTDKNFVKRLEGWKKTAPEIHIWDYHATFLNYMRYDTTFYSMTENLRYYAKNGIKGVQLQGALASSGEREGLRAWVLAKLMWNPQLDTLELIKDYCYGVFGRAGESIYPFYVQLYNLGKSGKRLGHDEDNVRKAGVAAFEQAYAALAISGNDPKTKKLLDIEVLPIRILQLEHLTGLIEQQAGNLKATAKLRKKFDRLYSQIESTVKREKIRFYGENRPMKSFLAKLRLWDFKKFPRKLPCNGILISAVHAKISWLSGPSFVADSKAGSGASMILPHTWAQFPIRWYNSYYPFLKKDGTFRIAIRCKVDSAKDDKEVLSVGYYHPKRGFMTFRKIKGAELSKEYRWIDCGTFKRPGGFGYLFVYTQAPNVAKNIRLDALELIPVKN